MIAYHYYYLTVVGIYLAEFSLVHDYKYRTPKENKVNYIVIIKLKAASQEEWIHLWKQHFKNLLGKSPKFLDEPITKIICNPLDIKLEQFTQEEQCST